MKQIAVITGGANRIGRAICLRLASLGYGLVIHYRQSQDAAFQTRADCLIAGASVVETVQSDLADPQARASFIDLVTERIGPITLLVNSASMFDYDNADSFNASRLNDHLQTNFLAPVELTMALYKRAVAAKLDTPPHVVTLLDQKVFNLNTDYMTYTLAKLASHASIRYLAQCCAPVVRVNAIAPGVTLVSGTMNAASFNQAHQIAALGHSSSPQDIANAVVLLDSSPAITGQTLVVDGGQHLVPRGRDVAFEV